MRLIRSLAPRQGRRISRLRFERLEHRRALAADFAVVPAWNGEATFPEAYNQGVLADPAGLLFNLFGGPAWADGVHAQLAWTNDPAQVHSGRGAIAVNLSNVSAGSPGNWATLLAIPYASNGVQRHSRSLAAYERVEVWLRNDSIAPLDLELRLVDVNLRSARRPLALAANAAWTRFAFDLPAGGAPGGWTVDPDFDLSRMREVAFRATSESPVSGRLLLDDLAFVERPWQSSGWTSEYEARQRLAERQFFALWGARDPITGLVPANSTFPDLLALNSTAGLLFSINYARAQSWAPHSEFDAYVSNLVATLEAEFDAGYRYLPPRFLQRDARGPLAWTNPSSAEESPIDAALLYLALSEYRGPASETITPLRSRIDHLLARFDFAPFHSTAGWRLNYLPRNDTFSPGTYSGYSTETYVMAFAAGLAGDVPIVESFGVGPDVAQVQLTNITNGYLAHSNELFRAGFEQWIFPLLVDVTGRGDIVLRTGDETVRWPNPEWNARRWQTDAEAWLSEQGRPIQSLPDAADNGLGGRSADGSSTYYAYSPWYDAGEPDLTMPWTVTYNCFGASERFRAQLEQGLAGPFGFVDSAVWRRDAAAPERWNGRYDLWNVSLSTIALFECLGRPVIHEDWDRQLDLVFQYHSYDHRLDLSLADETAGGDGVDARILRASPAGSPTTITLGGFGSSTQFIGDWDQDGFDDLLATAPGSNAGGDAGRAIVAWGDASLVPELAVDVSQPLRVTQLDGVRAIVSAEVIAPRLADAPARLAIGYASGVNTSGGALAAGDLRSLAVANVGPPQAQFASSTAVGDIISLASGNVNGDDWPDLLVGTSLGRAFLILGTATTPANTNLSGPNVEDVTPRTGGVAHFLQTRVALADYDGDGLDDLVFCGPLPAARQFGDVAFVVAGRADWNGFLWNDFIFDGVQALRMTANVAEFTTVVARPDSYDQRRDNLVFAAPTARDRFGQSTGRVTFASAWEATDGNATQTLEPTPGSTSTIVNVFGHIPNGRFGDRIAPVGDFDGNGTFDLAIAHTGVTEVLVWLDSLPYTSENMSDLDLWPRSLHVRLPSASEGKLGELSTRPGDWNGDGLMDLALGMPLYPGGGRVYIVPGRDIDGSITHRGTPGVDSLQGESHSNSLQGGPGDDALDGGATAESYQFQSDQLRGGAGNDRLAVHRDAYTIVSGGGGVDTLVVVDGSVNLVLESLRSPGTPLSIERIELDGAGPNHLYLSEPAAAEAWISESRRLIVRRGEDDLVVVESPWQRTGSVSAESTTFDRWSANGMELWIEQVPERDFGDAWAGPTVSASSYPTRISENGARHTLGGPRLGARIDSEPDVERMGDAWGDDFVDAAGTCCDLASSDEDGVRFPADLTFDATLGGQFSLEVELTNAASAKLDAWLDFNADGDWNDPDEAIFSNQPLAAGINSLLVRVPPNMTRLDTYARFRVSTVGGLAPTGLAADGEVEDYEISFTAPDVRRFDELDQPAAGAPSGSVLTRSPELSRTQAAGIGDFNGDGFDDVAVAYTSANSSFRGSVQVVWGGPSGLPPQLDLDQPLGSNGFSIVGPSADAELGYRLAGRGDFNGDGLADLALATSAGDAATGRVYVLFGSRQAWPAEFAISSLHAAQGGSGARGFVLRDEATAAIQTMALTFVGDLNADGRDELAYGRDFVESRARVYLLLGRESNDAEYALEALNPDSPRANDLGVTLVTEPNEQFSGLGSAVAGAGDVDGDGLDDVLIGLPYGVSPEQRAGQVAIFHGRDLDLSRPVILLSADPSAGLPELPDTAYLTSDFSIQGLGASVAGVGDANGDGRDDILVGSLDGSAYLVFGGSSFPNPFQQRTLDVTTLRAAAGGDGSVGVVFRELNYFDGIGETIAGAGDVNGDGLDDLLLGARWADPGSTTDAGGVYVLAGRRDGWPAEYELLDALETTGPDHWFAGARLGHLIGDSLSPAGDVNGDGLSDWVAGTASDSFPSGEAYVVLGRPIPAAQWGSAAAESWSGTAATDLFLGGLGDDRLDGVSGADVVYGGGGDDWLFVDTQFARVDGGAGFDTLVIRSPDPTWELSDYIGTRIQNIELVKFETDGHSLDVTLDHHGAASIAGPNHSLRFDDAGPSDVTVSLVDPYFWQFTGATIKLPDQVFAHYQRGSLELSLPMYPSYWTNPWLEFDVNADSFVSPVDALLIINELNERTITDLNGRVHSPFEHPDLPLMFWDVDADGFCVPKDALLVINVLNQNSSAEGEEAAAAPAFAVTPANLSPALAWPWDETYALAGARRIAFTAARPAPSLEAQRERSAPWLDANRIDLDPSRRAATDTIFGNW